MSTASVAERAKSNKGNSDSDIEQRAAEAAGKAAAAVLRKRGWSEGDIDEVAQDARAEAVEDVRRRGVSNRDTPESFGRRSGRDTARDAIRRKAATSKSVTSIDDIGKGGVPISQMIPDPAGGPQEVAEKKEDLERLATALERLPEKDRDLIRRKHGEAKSSREIAAELGMTVEAVDTSLSRARRKLRDLLSPSE
jgi:RNA polymerase sigma factor (sigma-70 family)